MERIMADVLYIIQAGDPYRKGDLKMSFVVEPTEDGFIVYTEMDYMQYTNEQWDYNRHWGKQLQNPHLYWFDEKVEIIADYLARLGGGHYVVK